MSRIHGKDQGIFALLSRPDAGSCRADALAHATLPAT
jgi:hypothetical protein